MPISPEKTTAPDAFERFTHTASGKSFSGLHFGDTSKPLQGLFLHANGFNAHTYKSLLGPLSKTYSIAALDQRGQGRSALKLSPDTRSWQILCEDIIDWIDAQAPKGLAIAGHSLGGCVALMVANQRPDLVKGLLLIDPVILPRAFYRMIHLNPFSSSLSKLHPMASQAMKRRRFFSSLEDAKASYTGRGAFKSWTGDFLQDYLVDGLKERDMSGHVEENDALPLELSCSPETESTVFAAQRNRPWQALKGAQKAGVPFYLLRGEFHSVMNRYVIKSIALKYAGIEIKTQSDSTHFIPMERPEYVRHEIRALMERV